VKYTVPGISTLIAFILWISEKWLSQSFTEELKQFPFSSILLVCLCILLGTIYADIFNENSSLRSAIRKLMKIASVEHFVLASKVENEESWHEAVVHIRFLSKISNVGCTIEVTQYVGLDHAQNSFVVSQQTIPLAENNLLLKLPVARFPKRVSKEIAVGYPYWGTDKNHTWAGDGRHIVTLKLSIGLRTQTEKFLISAIKNVGGGPEPVILFGPDSESYVHVK
jgi:hypothetical protein